MALTPEEIFQKVKKIEIATRRASTSVLSGQYHSRFKGHGMQFSEFREYYQGDDIRHIDWKVTARTSKPHLKLFEEERELTVIIAVDISASGDYSSEERLKKESIIEASALIAFSAIKNNDRVGLLLFSDKIEKYIPPKKGSSHGLRIIRDLIYTKATSNGTNINHALKFLTGVSKQTGIIFLASDFIDDGFSKSLKILGKRNDLIALRIYDKNESVFPKLGLVSLVDPETNEEFIVDTNSYNFRKEHHEAVKNQVEKTKAVLRQTGVGVINLSTHEEPIFELMKYFKRKRHA